MRWVRVVALVAVALLVVAGGVVAYISYRAGQSLIHPARVASERTPAEFASEWTSVNATTLDGVALVGWWVPADATPEDDRSVLFLHGYGDSKAQSLEVAPFLHRAGYNVLAFDFRGHGASGGDFTTVGVLEQRDVRAALDWLEAQPGFAADPDVALVGWSMGAATAILAAPGLDEVDAVVSDSCFGRVADVAGAGVERYLGLPPWPFGPLAVRFAAWSVRVDVADAAPIRSVSAVDVPLMLIHGEADSFIPVAHTDELARSNPRALVYKVEGADHVSSRSREPAEYERRVLAFLDGAFDAGAG